MSLGDRMKAYEHASRYVLPPRMPVIVRVDGKTFHSWTRGCERPFDAGLMAAMDAAAIELCNVVQTTQFAYVQSDEISLLLHPYKRHGSQPWFANELQKICSVSASVAAAVVSQAQPEGTSGPAFFDARAFVLPECEVANYFIWRQQDTVRNSVQMLARSVFSARECHRKTCATLIDMLSGAGHEWDLLSDQKRFGRLIMREVYEVDAGNGETVTRSRWAAQEQTPRFEWGSPLFAEALATEAES